MSGAECLESGGHGRPPLGACAYAVMVRYSRVPLASDPQPERHEPLPSVAALPGWIWRRTGRGLRILLACLLLGGVVVALVLAADIRQTKSEEADAQRRRDAEARAQRIRELRAEQRPRVGGFETLAPPGAGAPRRLEVRAEQIDELAGAIAADARRRVRRGALDGPILRVDCEPFPRTVAGVGAHEDLALRDGRYSCLAITSESGVSDEVAGAVLGHTYRALVHFDTGRYGYCKVSGQPGPSREQLVTTPRACGGR